MANESKDSNRRSNLERLERPDSRFQIGFFEALAGLIKEVNQHKSHIKTMFAGDFRSASRGTVLGQFWNIILPMIPISVYLLLVQLRVFPSYDGLEPAVYISFNVTLWYLLAGLVQRPMIVVKTRIAETMKTALPLSAAIMSSFAQLVFDTLVRTILVIVLILVFAQWPKPAFGVLVIGVMSSALFCFSLGLILSIFNAVYSDVERVTNIVLQYGIFVSGVIFPISSMGPLAWLEIYNPFAVFISALRNGFFRGEIGSIFTLLVWSAIAVFLLLVSVRFFYIMERRIRSMV